MIVDAVLILLVVVLAALGFQRGLFSQAWGLGALIVAWKGTPPVLQWLAPRLGSVADPTSVFGGFLLSLGVGFVLYVGLILVGRLVEVTFLERMAVVSFGNKVLGGLTGLLKGAIFAVLTLWLLQFGATYVFEADEALLGQLQASRLQGLVGGYNPLNLIYLSRLRPYLALGGATPRPLPKEISTPELEALVRDPAFTQAVATRDVDAVLRSEAFRAALRDPLVARRLNTLR